MYIVLLLHCHHYCYSLCQVIYMTWLLDNLHQVGKLIEETVSVFWVDLGYRLRSRNMIYYRVLGDDWHSICYCYITLLFNSDTVCTVYCYWLSSVRVWFSARHLGRGSGYVRNPPKTQIHVTNYQFQMTRQ